MPDHPEIYVAAADSDCKRALEIATYLVQHGYPATCRQAIQEASPHQWDDGVDRALRTANRLVLLLTKSSMPYDRESKREWFFFDQQQKPIHPVLLEDCELHSRLYDYGYIDCRFSDDVTADVEAALTAKIRPAPPLQPTQRVFVTDRELEGLQDSIKRLREVLVDNIGSLELSRDQLSTIVRTRPKTPADFQLARIAEWVQRPYRLNTRFVDLTLLVDRVDNVADRWLSLPDNTKDIRRIIDTRDEQAFVVLGAPGSGKSTLLRHLQLNHSLASLRDNRQDLAVLLNLSQYVNKPNAPRSPAIWLQEQFDARFPDLPPIEELLSEGQLLLLLDGLNEIPHDSNLSFQRIVEEWGRYLIDASKSHRSNRFIVSCRTLDYSAPLSTPDLPVPHIRIEAMSDDQVRQFLVLNARYGQDIWSQLKDSDTLDYFRTPYLLRLFVDQIGAARTVPEGRAALFSVFVGQALRREVLSGSRALQTDQLVTERDRLRLVDSQAIGNSDVTCEGPLLRYLENLATAMQDQTESLEALQVRMQLADIHSVLGAAAEATISAGCAMGVLEQDIHAGEVFFTHQLMQEYFAGRAFAASPNFSKARVEWEAAAVQPTLQELLSSLDETEALPPLPSTGWEETCRFAASLSDNPTTFFRHLSEENLALAADCAMQPGANPSQATLVELRDQLQRRSEDPNADLRARLAARRVLAEIGDPRFPTRTGPLGEYISPQFTRIPAGTYVIGSHEPNESPPHDVDLDDFELGVFPVTNAEYRHFVSSGAYENQSLWDTGAARVWLSGEGTRDIARAEWSAKREALRKRPDLPLELYRTHRINLLQAISFTKLAGMSESEFEHLLAEWYTDEPPVSPRFWLDDRYNHPAQPVVGVSWYEAAAYCKWFSIQSGQSVRLPTEEQWEAAARGTAPGTLFPYGTTFDAARACTSELHLLRPNPVGVFPNGVSQFGCHDMSGCVFEWVDSVFRPYPGSSKTQRTDNKQMGCRGGAWQHSRYRARTSYRGRGNLITRNNDLGFRLLREVQD